MRARRSVSLGAPNDVTMPHDTYAEARNAAYTFPSPLYVSLIAACVDSRVWTRYSWRGACTGRSKAQIQAVHLIARIYRQKA